MIALLAVALTGACGPSETTADPGPGPQELRAALPAMADVTGATAIHYECPGDDLCPPPAPGGASASISFVMDQPAGVDPRSEGGGYVEIRVTAFDETASFADQIARLRERAAEYDGQIDIEPQAAGGLVGVPGERGTGSFTDDIEIEGWRGFRADSRVLMYDIAPQVPDVDNLGSRLIVSHGLAVIEAQVDLVADGRPEGAAGDLATALVRDVISRLD